MPKKEWAIPLTNTENCNEKEMKHSFSKYKFRTHNIFIINVLIPFYSPFRGLGGFLKTHENIISQGFNYRHLFVVR